MSEIKPGDDLRSEMAAIFARFFRRSFNAGYSWVEFESDALDILDRAIALEPEPSTVASCGHTNWPYCNCTGYLDQ